MLLRKVEKRRWEWLAEDMPWLPPGDIPAAPLGDLRTSPSSRLSVWYVEASKSNLELVIAAVAATRDHLDIFDYALFSEDLARQADIHVEATRGDSADVEANDTWHRDLVDLAASKLVALARLIRERGTVERMQERRVKIVIRHAVGTGRIEEGRLKPELRRAISED